MGMWCQHTIDDFFLILAYFYQAYFGGIAPPHWQMALIPRISIDCPTDN